MGSEPAAPSEPGRARDGLAGIAAKVTRAREHLETLEAATQAFVEAQPHKLTFEFDQQSRDYLIRAHVEHSPPVMLGVMLGDYLHNLRSALDHLVWQIVVAEGNTPGRWNEFPIVAEEAQFRSGVLVPRQRGKRSPLLGVGDQAVQIVQSCQPYHPPPEPGAVNLLAVLHDFSNIDKHRVVHSTLVRLTDQPPHLTGVGFTAVRVNWGTTPVEDGAELGRLKVFVDRRDSAEVEIEGTIPVDLHFGDRGLPRRRLHELHNAVVVIINKFIVLPGEPESP